ncbi:metallophosphoesterase family protein [Amycolatopsis acidicola]|uniref:Metallophosphoesterase family protein n=1 Tax=Amycolatopsis acidicola TaxID=2596893 RepID=A0A5N0ULN3_9PSEU|nr:metallophosphoesterase family protein [Amycolatopsis acidicola]KAA9150840.1 metallophosphoesterase family protein [Amycolatopsis acidicola]
MRVAVLSDIHGNLPALDAVLADAGGADLFVLNGDLATGPMPAETLDRLAGLGGRAIWVRGNADRALVEIFDGAEETDLPAPARPPSRYAASRISREHRDLLAGLPLSVTIHVPGLGLVRFCHATPAADTGIVLVDSPVERFREAFAEAPEPVVVLGHTHMPFDRLAEGRRFVNPGSVGMPYGRPGAHWAMLGPDVVLRETHYDADEAARIFRAGAAGYPELEDFIEHNVRSVPSDAEALAVFSRW